MKKILVSIFAIFIFINNNIYAQYGSSQGLTKIYSCKEYSINYPDNWKIVQENQQTIGNTIISLQIMENKTANCNFRNNINIIVSNKKWKESTSTLANKSIEISRKLMSSFSLISKKSITLHKTYGTEIQYIFKYEDIYIRNIQYIVKKNDNTTFTITVGIENSQYSKIINTINKIINSIKFK